MARSVTLRREIASLGDKKAGHAKVVAAQEKSPLRPVKHEPVDEELPTSPAGGYRNAALMDVPHSEI